MSRREFFFIRLIHASSLSPWTGPDAWYKPIGVDHWPIWRRVIFSSFIVVPLGLVMLVLDYFEFQWDRYRIERR